MKNRGMELRELMAERILVLDGATGTMLQLKDLSASDFGGEALEGCNENLVFTRPDVILDVHREYLRAGADVIETNTFGGTSIVLEEYGLESNVVKINRRAAELAREAADDPEFGGRPRFVAGSIGPTTKAISVTGGITFAELLASFADQCRGLLDGGADIFFVETCQDTRNTKAALIAAQQVFAEYDQTRPLVASCTIEATGTMLGGQTAEAFVASLQHIDLLAIGLNCATGPDQMTDHLRSIASMATCAVSCFPNAGLPDEDGMYSENPERLATSLERFVEQGWINMVGGCCGTTSAHIAAIADMVSARRPRRLPSGRRERVFFSGVDLVEALPENRPLLVGERTNVIGSRKFKRLVTEEKWDEAAEIARAQVKSGAQVIDVCLQTTDRDEIGDVRAFYEKLIRATRAPIMIDTTDPAAVEVALTYCQGRAIVNSINLEDGEKKFADICPLISRYGAAVVVGVIDEHPEQAQAFTRERKLEVARRSHELLVTNYGIDETDIIFDPLVFPVASGDAAYVGAAVETIEGLKAIKREFPLCPTVLGISNVSFGLPTAAREVLNSVFLYHCTRAGLDLAIVNSERLERFASISDNDLRLAENLLLNRPPDEDGKNSALAGAPEDWREQTPEQRIAINRLHVDRIAERFRGAKRIVTDVEKLSLDERLANYIIEGTRDGLEDDLRLKLNKGARPLAIINGPLMAGMMEVGRLFNSNQLIVAEVLRSAEAMKVAVSFLEGFMEVGETSSRGKIVLATVKGDVHDIGKNLVGIILGNNGFDVVDLGIKVGTEKLISAVKEHRPDLIGLSGLLVKSAQQMVVTAEDLRAAAINVPLLVGGAALSGRFSRQRIAPAYGAPVIYCRDAMKGLDACAALSEHDQRDAFLEGLSVDDEVGDTAPAPQVLLVSTKRSSKISADVELLHAPENGREIVAVEGNLGEIWDFLNPQMLFGKHLGFRGSFVKATAAGDAKARELQTLIDQLKAEALTWMKVRIVIQFFEAEPEGNSIQLFSRRGEPLHRFDFPRQPKDDGLCVADLVLPSVDGKRDSIALFVATAGEGVSERSKQERERGAFLRSHAIQALGIETAEAAAEWTHARIRKQWGFPDPDEMTMKERFAARYRGKRYSPGYPAWPDLDDQVGVFQVLRPEEIGVQLTESMMMDPEAAVSAIVFHHPDARYFGI